ncbi:MAG: N-acetyl sugar amidotransferase [Alphaproteobacteria bacterium]|nr:N-acetyl sugar amidotransferase [Alphaproteobacteria bacterium]
MTKKYQICSKCVLDTSDVNISFDKDGVCNHCHAYDENIDTHIISDKTTRDKRLKEIIEKIKRAGKGKKYDCIVGISGGVDSSYIAYLASEWNLRALLVHLDNGWDSELAVKNIENIVKKTDFDLETLVINWNEFRDLQRSFFMADVIDLEMLSDHAIAASVVKLTRKHRTGFLFDGSNYLTEATMPHDWSWRKTDATNIRGIHKIYGKLKLKTFPIMGLIKKKFYHHINAAESISILNYLDYSKPEAMEILKKEFDWKYYGGKHYESIFTRFYQGYILPVKFGVDKRRAHHSTLICSKQMTREEALEDLKQPPYPEHLQKEDFSLVCKKLQFSEDEMNAYMARPPKSHANYPTSEHVVVFFKKLMIKLNLY